MHNILFIILAVTVASANGDESSDHRIIGGFLADISQFPFAVSIRLLKSQSQFMHICGGSIITNRAVVTASHCLVDQNGNKVDRRILDIYAGTSNLNGGGTRYQISAIRLHPFYKQSSHDYDVAILITKNDIVFNLNTQPIKLATQLPAAGTLAEVAGWGVITPAGKVTSQLRAVKVPLVSQKSCRKSYSNPTSLITDRMVCAGYSFGGKDACQGDSGGPLVVYTNKDTAQLLGVVSFGAGCAQPDSPGVYAKIPNAEIQQFIIRNRYTSWIGSIFGFARSVFV